MSKITCNFVAAITTKSKVTFKNHITLQKKSVVSKGAVPKLGEGIYTAIDTARILRIPYWKANYWFQYYVKHRLFDSIGYQYYFEIKDMPAVNFLSLIEMYVFFFLKDKGVKTNKIIEAHQVISQHLNNPYPFAQADLYIDNKKIFFKAKRDAFLRTGDKQLSVAFDELIIPFSERVSFNDKRIANRFYPLGKNKSVVVNPENQYGQPRIDGTNIRAVVLNDYYKGGDSIEFIAKLYNIKTQNVKDAIEFFKAA